MATAVVDLDFAELPDGLDELDHYTHAFILVRWRGRPVASTTLPVTDGRIDGRTLRTALLDAGGWLLQESWMREQWGPTSLHPKPLPRCTIAICTRERPADLRNALTAIACLPDDGQEVLVVDNCPTTEETRAVVAAFPGVRYVREDERGLNSARNRALRDATHPVVVFTDDDAVPDSGWLRALAAHFARPLVGCVTGLTLPLELETPAQEWFERFGGFGRGFWRRVFETPGHPPLIGGPIGAGVNMAVRRDTAAAVGAFDPALDAGTPTHSGGDHEMFGRLLTAGYQIVYEPEALSWHRHRRDFAALQATLGGYATGTYAAWTRSLVVDREWSALPLAGSWFLEDHLAPVIRTLLRRPNRPPSGRIALAKLRGSVAGPWAYRTSRRQREARP